MYGPDVCKHEILKLYEPKWKNVNPKINGSIIELIEK